MTEIRPRWASLTAEQREMAVDLYDRAHALMAASGQMSIGQALDAAAIQAGHLPQILPADSGEEE